MFKIACPILPIADFARTKRFYKKLGFEVAFEYSNEGYLSIVRDQVEIHFSYRSNMMLRHRIMVLF